MSDTIDIDLMSADIRKIQEICRAHSSSRSQLDQAVQQMKDLRKRLPDGLWPSVAGQEGNVQAVHGALTSRARDLTSSFNNYSGALSALRQAEQRAQEVVEQFGQKEGGNISIPKVIGVLVLVIIVWRVIFG
ncbi:hypothetical protein [Neokomagataea anthophila]|uniref:DUF3618 domain-containing protein n=1 Tax=Neokomagataea anthophila TaxID=2826925 RepID=A0ABS5EA85_9PROT|nr:hypothetical protein [Neokomagataea anthophila]MBR0560716.1 hypothetical protein [Neokomagataea anthophila]